MNGAGLSPASGPLARPPLFCVGLTPAGSSALPDDRFAVQQTIYPRPGTRREAGHSGQQGMLRLRKPSPYGAVRQSTTHSKGAARLLIRGAASAPSPASHRNH